MHIIFYHLLTYLLLLQNSSTKPVAHPLSQCPSVELQVCKQFSLHWLLQFLPNFPFSQPVVNNINLTHKIQFYKNIYIYFH